MKKLLLLFLLIVFLLLSLAISPVPTSASTLTFARLTADTPMFSEQNENSKVFTLPETYFVIVLSNANSTETGFVRVSYLDIVGYIRINDIEIVNFEPRPRHHAAMFKTKQFYNSDYVNLREMPNQNSQSLAQVAINSELFLYGRIQGTSLVGQSEWFYVRYEKETEGEVETIRGYLNYHQGTASEIMPNNYEIVVPNTNNNPPVIPGEEFYSSLFIAIFIIALSVPAVIVLLLLFKKKKPTSREPRSF